MAYCPLATCSQPISLVNDHRIIGVHFTHPTDTKPCCMSYERYIEPVCATPMIVHVDHDPGDEDDSR